MRKFVIAYWYDGKVVFETVDEVPPGVQVVLWWRERERTN